LGQTTIFPAITILPVKEKPYKYFSTGLCHNSRLFDIEIYTKGFPLEVVNSKNIEITDGIELTLRENLQWTLNDESFDITYEAPVRQKIPVANTNNHIIVSVIRIDVRSKNYRNDSVKIAKGTLDNYPDNVKSESNSLLTRIYNFFNNFRETFSTNQFNLTDVVSLSQESTSPNAKYPAISVVEIDKVILKKLAGKNEHENSIAIQVETKALPQETHLLSNLTLVSKITNLLHLYPYFSVTPDSNISPTPDVLSPGAYTNRIIDTTIEDIDYTLSEDYTKYISNINIKVITRSNYSVSKSTPSSLKGLLGWYRASSLNLNNNDPVTSWFDISGNNRHFVSDGFPPLYKAIGSVGNNKPVVGFYGAEYLISTDDAFKFNVLENAYSVFIVYCAESHIGETQAILSQATASDTNYLIGLSSTDKFLFQQGIQHSSQMSSVTCIGTPKIAIVKNGKTSEKGYINGQLDISSTQIYQNLLPSVDVMIGGTREGVNNTGFRSPLLAQIAEIAIYNHVLADNEINMLDDYACGEYLIGLSN
jgi:hypothetical protein